MSKRPLSITVISWAFVCVGCVSLAAGTWRFMGTTADVSASGNHFQESVDLALVSISAIVAIVGGVFVLRGFNWARWLLIAWMGGHIILSVLHSPLELVMHSVLFAAVIYVLARPQATAYFRVKRSQPW